MGMGSAHSTLWDFHDYDKYPKSMSRANGIETFDNELNLKYLSIFI